MNHYLITIQYDGSAHRGWQRLANESDTVQGILENALSAYFKESIRITGSGRTDAGVHALRQYADFFCRASLNIQDTQFLTDFNKTLFPPDFTAAKAPSAKRIYITQCFQANRTFFLKTTHTALLTHRSV